METTAAEPKKGPGWYENGVWQGMPKYQCEFCNQDSLHISAIQAHVVEYHTPQLIEQDRKEHPEKYKHQVEVPLYDSEGRLIEEY